MDIAYHLFSQQGGYEVNEDSLGFAECEGSYCFTLADGLGGHGCGEVASKIAVDTIKSAFAAFSPEESEEWLKCAFDKAQEAVLEEQKKNPLYSGMKTTLTVLAIKENSFQWGHIGDSRVYLFRRGKYYRRTLDHSVPQMLVASGEIKEKEIRGHADRNRLLRVLGTEWEEPRYELSRVFSHSKADAFLLCSDGFWELIEEKTMEKLLKKANTVEEWVESMAQTVIENGAEKKMDNFSAVGVWLG